MQAYAVQTDGKCACGCGLPVNPGTLWRKGHSERGKPKGASAWNWKGDDVAYKGVHKWVARYKVRTGICEHCERPSKRTEFANISGEYRRDVNDYVELCVVCHKRFDRKKA